MLLETELLNDLRDNEEIDKMEYAELLELDVTQMELEEAATRIVDHVALLRGREQGTKVERSEHVS